MQSEDAPILTNAFWKCCIAEERDFYLVTMPNDKNLASMTAMGINLVAKCTLHSSCQFVIIKDPCLKRIHPICDSVRKRIIWGKFLFYFFVLYIYFNSVIFRGL